MPILRARRRASFALLLTLVTLAPGLGCAADDACQAKLAAMRRTFEAIPADAATTNITLLTPDFPLLTSASGEPLRTAGPVVQLNADGSANLVRGDPSFDANVVVSKVVATLSAPGQDKVLYLAISPGVALGPHRALIRSLGDQAPLRVLIRDAKGTPGAPVAAPAMATRLAQLRNSPNDAKALQIGDALQEASGTCTAIMDGFRELGSQERGKQQAVMLDLALRGAEKCGCDAVDVDGLTAVLWTTLMGEGPPLRWLPLLPGPAGIKLPVDARTGDLVRLLEAGPALALPEPAPAS